MGEGLKKICRRHGGLTVTSGGVTKHYTAKDAEPVEPFTAFEEMTLISPDKKFRITWEWIGEGALAGDYQDDNPEDIPLLRCYCDVRKWTRNRNAYWEGIENASYCTQMDARTPRPILEKALKRILAELQDTYPDHKKAMEAVSHFCSEDFS